MAIPRYLLSPGEEGYLTPTIEDAERNPMEECLTRFNTNTIVERRIDPLPPQAQLTLNSKSESSAYPAPKQGLKKHFLQLKARLRHFTWTFFTMTMATGGIANVLWTVPFRFKESLFIPAAVVSFGTILLNISQYGLGHTGVWLHEAVYIMFWIDCALAIIASCGIYLIMWSTQTFTISQMTPIWIFPAYPLLIIGPHAGVLAETLGQQKALDVIIGGAALQGIGFMVSLMIYSAFIYRLMTQKLPKEPSRPGMFVSIGPSGFTVSGIINMARNAEGAFPSNFMGNGVLAASILKVVANWMGLWIWGLAFWFFFISVFAHYTCVGHDKMVFAMTWYSFVFPNTALITATFAIGKAFDAYAIQIIGCVMTVALICMWIFVFVMMIRAIILKQILWPQKDQDRDEGGWKTQSSPFQHMDDWATRSVSYPA
ncbi:MAG: hypothetical protein M1834_003880 [Cirrosporium novae-zelandiae]|nr:MAG: hypothetical protein M1834_003880 [Cirrosporium novae-zelandiae]